MIRKALAVLGAVLTIAIMVAIPTLLFGEARAVAGVVEGPDYAVEPLSAATTSGAEAKIGVRLVGKGAFKIHMDGAPLKISFTPPKGVMLKQKQLGRADAVDAKAKTPSFLTAASASAVGEHLISTDVDFVLCSAKVCKPVKAKLNLKLTISAAP